MSKAPKIDKLDYPANSRTPLLHDSERVSSPPPQASGSLRDRFFEHVAEGIEERDRDRIQNEVVRYLSFTWAIISCLCAGSITTYSLYAPLFQTKLNYSQYQVTSVSIAAQVALYLPVPLFGFLCDRFGPRLPALISAVLFGLSYTLAAFAFHSGPLPGTGDETGHGWPVVWMVVAFIGIGMATSCLYFASITTCAKNFGRSKNKGIALAAPTAAFGLSGMWISQVGSKLLYERNLDGSKGDVDVFRYFIFLAGLLFGVSVIGSLLLRVVNEEQLIDEAVEELERSGLLENTDFFHNEAEAANGYGTLTPAATQDSRRSSIIELNKSFEEQEARKKTWLLNAEAHRFLTDPTMWLLTAGFFLVSGPGDAFINNFGTVLGTLYPSPLDANDPSQPPLARTDAATHVAIIAVGSTFARLLAGAASDILSPPAVPHQHRRGPASLTASLRSLDPGTEGPPTRGLHLSRIPLLLFATLLFSAGFVVLASGTVQDHAAPRFAWVTSLVGIGYGAVFSLVPIIIACVWGTESFGTNWGIVAMVPALSGALWGLIYAAGYSTHAEEDGRCYGKECYAGTFWGMAVALWVACILWIWAWRGPGGWKARDVAV